MLPPGSGTKTMCLFHPEPWLHHHELPAELSSEHATQHPVPILPLLGRAVRQHVPLKMMHGFVMHQRENIKEFNSCTELCGDCIRFVWKVHNTSHMQQEHNSVCSIHLCRRTPFLRRGGHGSASSSRVRMAPVRWERQTRGPCNSALVQQSKGSLSPNHVNCHGLKSCS